MYALRLKQKTPNAPSMKREIDDATMTKMAGMAYDFYNLKQDLLKVLGQINWLENDLDTVMSSMDSSDPYFSNVEKLADDIASITGPMNSLGL